MSRVAKIAFMLWSSVFVALALAFGILSLSSSGKVFNAEVKIIEIKEDSTYKARIVFDSVFFRSQNHLSRIDIQELDLRDKAIQKDNINANTFEFSSQMKYQVGDSLGTITYSVKFLKSFLLKIFKYYIFGIVIAFISVLLKKYAIAFHLSLPNRVSPFIKSKPLNRSDKIFLYFSGILCLSLCAFQFYLGFPGYHIIGDTYNSIALVLNNAHPVFIPYVLKLLYVVFGKHLYYLFLFNIVPFYAGIFFLIAGFYIRFRTKFAILLILPIFIGNIYFQNFVEYHSFALPMMLFCGYSMILFTILANSNYKLLWSGISILLFFAILWRHNAIFSVYPAFIIICYLYLRDRGLENKIFAKKYTSLLILSAILCLFIVIAIPKILTRGVSYPANHPLLHQIAGACVPSNDSSCFRDEWYYPNKSFSDVVALYKKYPLNADPFNVPWGYDDERPFKHEKLVGLKKAWLKAILKYPNNFLNHELRFIKAMWIQEPRWIFDAKYLQNKASHPWHIAVVNGFKENERSITLSPFREQIYSFLYEHRILFNHIYGVVIGGILMLVSFILLFFKRWRSDMLVFCFSTSFASFASAFFIAAFSTVPETRYMSPILPLSIIALIGFIAFICDKLGKRKIISIF